MYLSNPYNSSYYIYYFPSISFLVAVRDEKNGHLEITMILLQCYKKQVVALVKSVFIIRDHIICILNFPRSNVVSLRWLPKNTKAGVV